MVAKVVFSILIILLLAVRKNLSFECAPMTQLPHLYKRTPPMI